MRNHCDRRASAFRFPFARPALFSLLGLMLLAAPTFAQLPPDPEPPEHVFERCVREVRHAVHRCTTANEETTKECLRKIRVLLENGEEERARAVARDCIEVIENRTQRCVRYVRAECQQCIEVLLEMEAPELARKLRSICEHAVEKLHANARRAINAIRSAFD